MKIGINLIGLSSHIRNRDWRRTKDEIYNKIINCWEGHEVKLYLTTNNISYELLNFYQPNKYQEVYYDQSFKQKYKISLELLKSENLDFIITTRFDIIFFEKISLFNIDYNKFNFLFKEIDHWDDGRKYTCDNFYAFPSKYIIPLQNTLNNIDIPELPPDIHHLYSPLSSIIGEDNIHFITEEYSFSGSGKNPFYLLDRYDNIDGDLGPTSIEKFNKINLVV
jgi:hypothetical protein